MVKVVTHVEGSYRFYNGISPTFKHFVSSGLQHNLALQVNTNVLDPAVGYWGVLSNFHASNGPDVARNTEPNEGFTDSKPPANPLSVFGQLVGKKKKVLDHWNIDWF